MNKYRTKAQEIVERWVGRGAYRPLIDDIANAMASVEEPWRPVAELAASGDPERLVLGYSANDDAMMIWRASMLLRNLAGPTPQHLMFAATHFREMPAPPQGLTPPRRRA